MLARLSLCLGFLLPVCVPQLYSTQAWSAAVSPDAPGHLVQELDEEVPNLMAKWHIPGMSICVVRDGAVLWQRGLGVKNVTTQEQVDDQTVFLAASLTKPVFAYAVLKMCDEGLLDLDKPLVEYAPVEYIEESFLGHPMDAAGFKKEWFAAITARMVLSHSSGLQHFGLKNPVEMLFEPGTGFYYSSNGIEYLRYIVEHVKVARIDELVSEYVFRPLNMEHSSLVWRDDYEGNSAACHDMYGRTSGSIERFEEPTAQASLYTTAQDYAKFLLAVLNGTGLKTETYREMTSPQIQCHPQVRNVYWGLGVGIETNGASKGIWHFGDGGSFTSYFYCDVNDKCGFVYFVNGHYGLAILDEIFALTCPGDHPALHLVIGDWSFWDDYLSPAMEFKCRFFNGDVDGALEYYGQVASVHEKGNQFIEQDQLLRWACGFLKRGQSNDAIQILQLAVEAYHANQSESCKALLGEYAAKGTPDAAIEYIKAASSVINNNSLKWTVDLSAARLRPVRPSQKLLESVVGSYGSFEIELDEAGLWFGRRGAGEARIIWLDDDTFVMEEAEGVWIDIVKEDDTVAALSVVAGNSRPTVYQRNK